ARGLEPLLGEGRAGAPGPGDRALGLVAGRNLEVPGVTEVEGARLPPERMLLQGLPEDLPIPGEPLLELLSFEPVLLVLDRKIREKDAEGVLVEHGRCIHEGPGPVVASRPSMSPFFAG